MMREDTPTDDVDVVVPDWTNELPSDDLLSPKVRERIANELAERELEREAEP
jgi:hypothetical protein